MSDSDTLVRMFNAGLDEDDTEIILRGVLVPEALTNLRVDTYQREILPIAKLLELTEAFQSGSVPDIDLGMRGGNYSERDGIYILRDPVYIIDGLQRRTAALEAMKSNVRPRLGATVHFNTTMEWERRRFRILNVAQTKLSPNVLLRNMYLEGSPSLEMLHGLTLDSSFPLCRRVNWDQRQHKEHLISALTMLKSVAQLHSHLQAGLRDTGHFQLVGHMDKLLKRMGHTLMRSNCLLFWQLIDELWGVRNIEIKQFAAQIKQTFLGAFSALLSNHTDFWADARLMMGRELRSKLNKFPIRDPHVISLCGAGGIQGGARKMLYQMLVEHVNSGKRTRRLTPRKEIEKYSDNVVAIHMDDVIETRPEA